MLSAAKNSLNRILKATLLSSALLFPSVTFADLELTGFRQAVAEAAAQNSQLADFYRGQTFDGLWTGSDAEVQIRRNAFLTSLSEAPLHGLPTDRYNVETLMAELRAAQTPGEQGRMDVEMSRLFLQYANDIHGGILDPGSVISAIKRDRPALDGGALLREFQTSDAPDAYLRGLAPSNQEYTRLMRQKLQLESLIEGGGWGPVVVSGTLSRGAEGAPVVALRNRLMAMGYLQRSVTQTYNQDIVRAVQAFQLAHGLVADGEAGAATLEAINTSAVSRLQQVLVAMERERWMNYDRGDRNVWVNLTDFHVNVVDFEEVTFRTRSVIGALGVDRETPEFSEIMTHLVINPTWYVPRSITVNEYLPGLRRNASAHGHLQIVDSRGRIVNRGSVDFSRFTSANFPFSMRQPPSNRNALGRVKFMLPNQWNIYLHDTPAQNLFQREVRAFSHGCVRLDDPYDLAYHLLAPQLDDPVGFFQAQLHTGREARVNLDVPIPVHIVYRTAFTDIQGRLQFRADIYGRDARIWNALATAGVVISSIQG